MTHWLETDHGEVLAALWPWMDDAIDVPIPKGDLDLLIGLARGDPATISDAAFSATMREALEEAIATVGAAVFVRTSFSSFRPVGGALAPAAGIADVETLLRRRNDRVAALLEAARAARHPVSLFVSAWRTIAPHAEFRAFVYRGKVAGISQRFHRSAYPEIERRAAAIEADLRSLLAQALPHLPSETLVVDLEWQGAEAPRAATIIEVNPFTRATDPCLFSWDSGGDFDYGFRIRPLRNPPPPFS